jgi:two-component system, NtrC family, sensor kinase
MSSRSGHGMFARWTIRKKLQITTMVLGMVIAVLGYSGFRGVYAYKELAASLSSRASEVPITSELTRAIDELRIDFENQVPVSGVLFPMDSESQTGLPRLGLLDRIQRVREVLASYKSRLENAHSEEQFLSDRREELTQASEISELLNEIAWRHQQSGGEMHRIVRAGQLQDMEQLSELAHQLPTLLTRRMVIFRDEVRTRYRTWIVMTWSSAILSGILLVGLIAYARHYVVRPFKELLAGARRVAGGDFTARIAATNSDEIAELAQAINLGAQSFLSIQRDLNEQVRQRSEEVIRNEQLASVGFLAAGVAHEINNPLASIAWSAEALETRLHRILHTSGDGADANGVSDSAGTQGADLDTLRSYLRRIQDEAFRCKGITERLLDFSRLGNIQRKQACDMNEIVMDVVDMVRHMSAYRKQKVDFQPPAEPTIAWASPQEMKQVVLNLLTNALESFDAESTDGCVTLRLEKWDDSVRMVIEDNGCGMTDEVLKHLFEPFFTRRRDGRGTGLGLPITNRIIADHGGRITPKSRGPGFGSRFEVTLPSQPTNDALYDHRKELSVA